MANLNGSLNMASLDERLVDSMRDTSVASGQRYQYLQDAYSRIWYKHPWAFTHATATFTAASGTSDYTINAQIAEVQDIFNATKSTSIIMNKGMTMYHDSYIDDGHVGPLQNLIDIREDGPDTHLVFQEAPGGTGQGDGDTINLYYCKHIIHNDYTGATATGNMGVPTDVPSFAPQFHAIIVKEALLEAIKNRRDFQEMYQLAKIERDEMLVDMKRHYLTPRKSTVLRIYR